jgi:hypothetical protein
MTESAFDQDSGMIVVLIVIGLVALAYEAISRRRRKND